MRAYAPANKSSPDIFVPFFAIYNFDLTRPRGEIKHHASLCRWCIASGIGLEKRENYSVRLRGAGWPGKRFNNS